MKRLPVLLTLLCFAPLLQAEPTAIARHVVLILADDLGYADVGYHGCRDVATPNIDRLAKGGVTFSSGYVTASICGPTRAGLMTGRYQQRLGAQGNIGPRRLRPDLPFGLNPEIPTLGKRFQDLEFKTACIGKWHLGGEILHDKRLMPNRRGFDVFFGFLEGAASYWDHENRERKYMRNEEVLDGLEGYYTDLLGQEAVQFIEANKDQRFFLYLPFNAVHAPMHATERDLERVRQIENPDRRKFAAMLTAMDDQIGEVLDALDRHQLTRDTLIIFLSDNGGDPRDNFSVNHPLRGQKNTSYEGGIRVPYLVHWPAGLPAGTSRPDPVSSLDIFPTAIAAVGGDLPEDWQLEGINLLPALRKNKPLAERTLYWKEDKHRAIRHANWKLVKHGQGPWELYDIAADLSETTDLAAQHPERVAKLKKLFAQWDADNVPPHFGWSKDLPHVSERVDR